MPSKKRSTISRKDRQQPETSPRFLLDRSLGRHQLAAQLASAGFDVTPGDDAYSQDERDPWIFYDAGKKGMVVITSDKEFMKSFPHMAAITLGRTTALAFTSNNYKSNVRGKALIKARGRILKAIAKARGEPFIGSIGMDGNFNIVERNPRPSRKYCDERDWRSYENVCRIEGVQFEGPKSSSPEIRGGDDGSAEDQAGTESAR